MLIKTGSVSAEGKLCLVLEDLRDRYDDLVLFVNDGGANWQRLEPEDLIAAVCPIPNKFLRDGYFVAISEEGNVFELPRLGPPTQIVGAGYENPGALNRGPLVFAELVGAAPTAMGFRGQVYAMQATGDFLPLGTPFPDPEDHPEDDIKFVSGAYSDRQRLFYFVGTVVTATPDSDAVNAANDANDSDALVAALLAETRADYGCVFTFDGKNWRQLEIPTNDAIDAVKTDGAGNAYVRLREGAFVALPSPDEWQVLYEGPSQISGESRYGENIIFAAGDTLLRVAGNGTEPFEPPMPPGPGYIVEVTAAGGLLVVIRSQSVLVYDGSAWSRRDPPVELGD